MVWGQMTHTIVMVDGTLLLLLLCALCCCCDWLS
jgi:hypothetical protein